MGRAHLQRPRRPAGHCRAPTAPRGSRVAAKQQRGRHRQRAARHGDPVALAHPAPAAPAPPRTFLANVPSFPLPFQFVQTCARPRTLSHEHRQQHFGPQDSLAMPSRTLVLWPTAVVLLVTRPSVHWACDCSGHPASAVCAAAPLTLTPSPRLPTGSRLAGIDTLCRGNARLGLQDSRLRRRCSTTSRTTPPRAVGFGAPAPRCALRACWPGASALVCVRA